MSSTESTYFHSSNTLQTCLGPDGLFFKPTPAIVRRRHYVFGLPVRAHDHNAKTSLALSLTNRFR